MERLLSVETPKKRAPSTHAKQQQTATVQRGIEGVFFGAKGRGGRH
jgi:hypothetical protein